MQGNALNKFRISLVTLAAGLAVCTGLSAQVFARSDHQARQEAIALRDRSAQAACARLAGQPKSVCFAEADAEDSIARADLAALYRPSAKARHRALVVAADSRLVLAKVRCDDRSGSARNGCVAQALQLHTSARADATARLKTFEANAMAAEQSAEDREEAASDTFAVRYAAARLQCDGYVDKLRELCLQQTRDHFLKL
jgi:hypothetical protein